MILLQAQNAVKVFDGKPLFDPVSFEIKSGERVALIGLNGAGKSTILKMAMGLLPVDEGNMVIGRDVSVGYLSQDVISSEDNTLYQEAGSVFADVKRLIKEIDDICQRMAKDPSDINLQNSYAAKEAELEKRGGYDYEYHINTILTSFGFPKECWERKITTFSGGEKSRIAFAKLLLLNPDLLILDEPTNHLDIVTIEWLENYLKSYKGAVFFVSHDKYFINNLATKILELENGKLSAYYGNYDQYALEKQHRYELALKQYNRQQKEMERMRRFITFYMPKPRFASRAHDREKKLARLEKTAINKPTEVKNKVHIDFQGEIRADKELLRFKDVSVGYADGPALISAMDLTIRGQDHIAIMGPNGTGKSTLVKTIMGQLKPKSGDIEFMTRLSLGYLQQDFMNIKDPRTIFNYFKDNFPLMEDQKIYNHLGSFAFSYDDDNQKTIDSLSGGEQMRVILAKLCLENYDILILDEPTNHLDLFTKSELEDALSDYKGTLITVSHDRDFVDSVANRIVYLYQGKAYVFEGSYSDFAAIGIEKYAKEVDSDIFKDQKEAKPVPEAPKINPILLDQPEEKPKKVSEFTAEKLMEKITKKEQELEELEKLTDSPDYYHDMAKLDELQGKIDDKQDEINKLYKMLDQM